MVLKVEREVFAGFKVMGVKSKNGLSRKLREVSGLFPYQKCNAMPPTGPYKPAQNTR
jgi:hypothetical protein